MRKALIDIGSNTIRFVAYENDKEIENYADHQGLIAYVSNFKISPEGIMRIVSSLRKMKKSADELGCYTVYAFATASLRDIDDVDELIDFVFEETGIKIHLVSALEEAHFDFEGLKKINGAESGVAFDLGGGSCQVLVFDKGELIEANSFRIGGLKLHSLFVSGVLPTDIEAEQIRSLVKDKLSSLKKLSNNTSKTIFAMGGSGFALAGLDKFYFGGDGVSLTLKSLENMMTLTEKQIEAVAPKRVKTIIPATIVMTELLKATNAEKITISSAGVRDGILAKISK